MNNYTPEEALLRSQEIDRQIEEDAKNVRRECKILLPAGLGGSGKSTILKQMKIIHQNGYTRDELQAFRSTIWQNLLDSAHDVILAMRKFDIHCDNVVNRERTERILSYKIFASSTFYFSEQMGLAIYELWQDAIIPKLMDHSSQFYLMDNADYFFTEALRIGRPDYVPTVEDVLRAREKSAGIKETRFNQGLLSIRIIDVSGQRSEQKKWIHCFEGVTSILFCADLSDYDGQILLQPDCRMHDSLRLFDSVINSRWFRRASIILLLTKIDVFKSKLPKVPLEKCFPEYTGGADIQKALKYILWRFMQTNRARLSVYPHLTQSTDTSNIRLIFAAVKDTIKKNALKDASTL
ncbi:G-protein alpha subunit [Obba rivulosa]|uniref:G-protein alpha subunit n=1 Tax=Obba rivulosa TaxID=1052685 RepID=A0A8E2J2T0_9APHY|nr:G-protein alpha subunit [Obba rivulosa]